MTFDIDNLVNSIISDYNIEDLVNTNEKIIASILSMDEDKFNLIKDALLESIEDSFSRTQSKLILKQIIRQNDLNNESLDNFCEEAFKAIEAEYHEKLSANKIDFLKQIFTIIINAFRDSDLMQNDIICIPIELCREGAKLPTYATDGSAAMDVYAPEKFSIEPGETKIIPLGIKVNIPKGYALLVQPRSGLSAKTKLRIANTPGLIDSDFHNEIGLIIENISNKISDLEVITELPAAPLYGSIFTIEAGERCCQLRLVKVPMIEWLQVNSIGNFDNDHGTGFGSTGKM